MSATLPQRQTRSLAVTLLLLGACGGGGSGGPVDGAPVAHAGADQPTPLVGDVVFLEGSASADDDGDPLRFAWELAASPPGSAAALSDPGAPDPSFVADLAGEYVWRLTVSDGIADSEPDEVSVTVRVPPPGVTIGAPVDLEVVTSSPVTVTGTVDDPDATVTVNGVEAATAAGGYSASVALAEGANTVTAVARNGTGESEAAVEVILNTTANPKASITWPRSGFVVGEEFAMGAPFHAAQLTVSGVVKVNTSAFLPGNNKPVVLVGGVAASVP